MMVASRILIFLLVTLVTVIETSGFSVLPSPPVITKKKSLSSAPILLGSLSPLENISNNNVDDTTTAAAAADALFAKFDSDKNGYIDRNEFRAVAQTMKASSRRREILSVATATFGSIFVATGSNTFQTLQKTFRSQYMEQSAEVTMNELFPTSLLSADLDNIVAKVLSKRGFTPENTLFGHSVCADEVNNRKEQLIPLMVNRWQEGFALGGLGGLPFSGKSGFGAYLHHVPDNGKLLVVFAPHVGIDEIGRVGSLQRDGQAKLSSACGAAVGAYKELQKKKKIAIDPLLVMEVDNPGQNVYDPQLTNIVSLLSTKLDGIEESSDSIAFVTYQMYGIIRELITACITETTDLFDYATEVAVVGGIMINRRKGGDFFQPLCFETRKKGERPLDIFEEAFGNRPNLEPIIGTRDAMDRASLY